MTTVPSVHSQRQIGDPPMSVIQGNTLVDDMSIIRKLCLPEKYDISQSNRSHMTYGLQEYPRNSCYQMDFKQPNRALIEPKSVRIARSVYMNNPHYKFGYETYPAHTEHQRMFQPPKRENLLEKKIFNIGAPNDLNKSNLFADPANRGAWADDIETTQRIDYRPPNLDAAVYDNKKAVLYHRGTHYDFGTDPPCFESDAQANFITPPTKFMKQHKPQDAQASSVQIFARDYPWHKNLKTTYQNDFPVPLATDDALTEFMLQKQPPICFGDNQREMMTEHRGAYKKNEFLDCSQLTNEQLAALGVTREQIIPKKIPLNFLKTGIFRNTLGQTF